MQLFVTSIKGSTVTRMYGYTIVDFKHMTNKLVVWI